MIKPTYEILNQRGTPMFFSDVFANRPTPGIVGRIFISTDTFEIYRDTGTTWDLIGGAGTGTIGGTIATGQVAFGTALDTIGGTNNLFWDQANNRLGILTTSPQQALHVNGIIQAVGDNAIAGNGLSFGYLIGQYGWIQSWGTRPLSLNGTGNNVVVGTWVGDNGNTFQVYGSTFIKGLGNTSATNSLTIQNSDGFNLFRVRNDSSYIIGNSSIAPVFFPFQTTYNVVDITGRNLQFFNQTSSQSAFLGAYYFAGSDYRQISGAQIFFNIVNGFIPTSGNGQFSLLNVGGTINQTGGANGITRGLYVNPTLTSAADWRSIEWTNNTGYGLYGSGTSLNYLNGNLLLGTLTNNGQRLQVSGDTLITGSGSTNATLGLLVRNSSSTNLFSVTNAGNVRFGNAGSTAPIFFAFTTAPSSGDNNGTNLSFFSYTTTQSATGGTFAITGDTLASTSAAQINLNSVRLFSPSSGNANFINTRITSTINQTGGANGITRGLLVTGTFTSATDYRAIEFDNGIGWGLYGAGSAPNYLNGTLSIATTSSTRQLTISGSGTNLGIDLFTGSSSLSTFRIVNVGVDNNTIIGSLSNNDLIFVTQNNERARIKTITGNFIINNSSTDTGERLQVTGTQKLTDTRTYSTGAIQSFRVEKNLTIPSGATISTGSTLSNEVLAGTNLFQGSVTIPNSSPFAGLYASNLYSFSAGSFTITSTQATGVRALSQIAAQNYFGGSFSGTLTHVSSIQIGAFLNNSTGTITPVITNAYQLLINDINESAHTFTISNRWGIYQEGSNDRNYLAGKTLVGSSTDTGEQFQLTGSIRVNNQLSGTSGGNSGQHLIINCDGTIYKIALQNN